MKTGQEIWPERLREGLARCFVSSVKEGGFCHMTWFRRIKSRCVANTLLGRHRRVGRPIRKAMQYGY